MFKNTVLTVFVLSMLTACAGTYDPPDLPAGDPGEPYQTETAETDGGSFADAEANADPGQDAGPAQVIAQDALTDAATQHADVSVAVVEGDASTMMVDAGPLKVDASTGTPDAALVTRDGGSMPDANVPTDGSIPQEASMPEAATTDAGGIIVLPPVDAGQPAKPYLERACSAPVDCSGPYELPKDPNVYTIEAPLCVAAAGATAGVCSFFCSYHSVIDGKDVWVYPANSLSRCAKVGGACVDVGLDRLCLPKGGAQ